MSASFTIDGAVYPAQSGTVVYFDKGLSVQNAPAKRVTKFGDGYAMHMPIGSSVRSYSASFSNRPTSEIEIIETYFTLLKGEGFDISVRGETIHVIALGFNKSYQNGQLYSLSANLREYFN
jgi:phage-related protein